MVTKCPQCGEKMALVGTTFTPPTSRLGGIDGGKVEMQTRCVNEDCPGVDGR